MSRNTRIVVGVVALLVLMCACGAVASVTVLRSAVVAFAQAIKSQPVAVAEAASGIAEFSLPPGYRPEASINVAGYQFVSYSPGDGHSHIMLIQAPPSLKVDRAALENALAQATQGGDYRNLYDRHARVRAVGQAQVTIRDQPVTLVISEGTNSDGQPYRAVTGVFQGRGGLALVSVEEPVSRWDQAEVDAFISSIH